MPISAIILKTARLELGMTQEQVANESGITLGQYQRLEYGCRDLRNSSMRVGLAICRTLNLDPFLVIFGKDDKRPTRNRASCAVQVAV